MRRVVRFPKSVTTFTRRFNRFVGKKDNLSTAIFLPRSGESLTNYEPSSRRTEKKKEKRLPDCSTFYYPAYRGRLARVFPTFHLHKNLINNGISPRTSGDARPFHPRQPPVSCYRLPEFIHQAGKSRATRGLMKTTAGGSS